MKNELKVTYIGGPTALLEINGLRLLTDPTLDPAGTEYATKIYTLRKTIGPALDAASIGKVDAVLLSHDHHFDNLDRAGREFLPMANVVLTTPAGAERIGATPLKPWDTYDLKAADGKTLRITGTPARHGPPDGDRGPVTGFVLTAPDSNEYGVYVSGDTVWYDGVIEVSQRFKVKTAFLFMGAARVKEVGPAHLTFTAEEGVEAARALPEASIVPLHYEGWMHFSESKKEITAAFAAAGIEDRLRWPERGTPTSL